MNNRESFKLDPADCVNILDMQTEKWKLTEKALEPWFITLYTPDRVYFGDLLQNRIQLQNHSSGRSLPEHLGEMRTQGGAIIREVVSQREHFHIRDQNSALNILVPGDGPCGIRDYFRELCLNLIKINSGAEKLQVDDITNQDIEGKSKTKAADPKIKAWAHDDLDRNFLHVTWFFLVIVSVCAVVNIFILVRWLLT